MGGTYSSSGNWGAKAPPVLSGLAIGDVSSYLAPAFTSNSVMGRSQVVKAPVFGTGTRRFESSRPSQFNLKVSEMNTFNLKFVQKGGTFYLDLLLLRSYCVKVRGGRYDLLP